MGDLDPRVTKGARLVFWGAAGFALLMALLPHPPEVPGDPSDKVQHIVAFVVLGALAAFAWPRASPWRLVIALSAFGALIEVLQAIPALNRDSDIMDWVADTGAAALVLSGFALWRRSRS